MGANALNIVQKYFPDVKRVHDAGRPVILQVTAADSKNARTRDHSGCAMAVAARRTFHARGVIISIGQAYVIKKDSAIRFKLPPSVSREVVSFDRNAGFAEGEYKMSAPSKSHRHGARNDRARNTKNHPSSSDKTKPETFKHFTPGIRAVLGHKDEGASRKR
jgi:hypothetical protein